VESGITDFVGSTGSTVKREMTREKRPVRSGVHRETGCLWRRGIGQKGEKGGERYGLRKEPIGEKLWAGRTEKRNSN